MVCGGQLMLRKKWLSWAVQNPQRNWEEKKSEYLTFPNSIPYLCHADGPKAHLIWLLGRHVKCNQVHSSQWSLNQQNPFRQEKSTFVTYWKVVELWNSIVKDVLCAGLFTECILCILVEYTIRGPAPCFICWYSFFICNPPHVGAKSTHMGELWSPGIASGTLNYQAISLSSPYFLKTFIIFSIHVSVGMCIV